MAGAGTGPSSPGFQRRGGWTAGMGKFQLGQCALFATYRTKHPRDASRAPTAKRENPNCRRPVETANSPKPNGRALYQLVAQRGVERLGALKGTDRLEANRVPRGLAATHPGWPVASR